MTKTRQLHSKSLPLTGLLAAICAGALAFSCGGESDGTDNSNAEDPQAEGNTNGEAGDGLAASGDNGSSESGGQLPTDSAQLPINTGGGAAGTSLNLFELLETEPCRSGWIDDEGATPNCNATFRGVCFESNAEACECGGCGLDACAIAESFPTQVSCTADALPGSCDFLVFDICHDSADAACEAAGCSADGCVVLESYPAQIRCE